MHKALHQFIPRPTSRYAVDTVVFPFAGGSPSSFRGWISQWTEHSSLFVAQLPGRGRRLLEAPFRSINDAADELAGAIASACSRPVVLFGHSMGAVVAYECARRLEAQDGAVSHVVISGCSAPDVPRRIPRISHLDDEPFVAQVASLGVMPRVVLENRELLDMLIPGLRADFAACESYHGPPVDDRGPRLAAPITAFAGDEDVNVPGSAVGGWERYTNAFSDLHIFPGGHFFINDAEARVLERVRTIVDTIAFKQAGDMRVGSRDVAS